MARFTEDEYAELVKNQAAAEKKPVAFNRKVRTIVCPDCGVEITTTSTSQKRCKDCAKKVKYPPTPEQKAHYKQRQKESDKYASLKRYGDRPAVKTRQVVNKCHYCGKRADSADIKRTYTDADQVKWFRCPCMPLEAQLVYVAVVKVD